MLRLRDDRDRLLTFTRAPKRVVSLVPSDTYSVAALGCANALVGKTDYCVEPDLPSVPSVGGTKNPRLEQILDLKPDLVIANQEENTRSDLEKLAQAGARVYVSFPKRVAEGVAHLAKLARVFQVEEKTLVKRAYEVVREGEAIATRLRAFYPIWLEPLMTVSGETYISDAMELVGLANIFSNRKRRYPLAADLGSAPEKPAGERDVRYPRVRMDEVRERAPEITLLSDEPFAFGPEHLELFPSPRAQLISGKDLSWYGAYCVIGLPRVRRLLMT